MIFQRIIPFQDCLKGARAILQITSWMFISASGKAASPDRKIIKSVSLLQKNGLLGKFVVSDVFFPVAAAIQNPADFHHVSGHHIENDKIPYPDAIIEMLTLPG